MAAILAEWLPHSVYQNATLNIVSGRFGLPSGRTWTCALGNALTVEARGDSLARLGAELSGGRDCHA